MRAYLKIRFNRPIDLYREYLSTGSYTIRLRNGRTKQFDFIEDAAGTSEEDAAVFEANLRDVDRSYEDGAGLTLQDIRDTVSLEEVFVGNSVNEHKGDQMSRLDAVELLEFSFSDDTGSAAIPKPVLKEAMICIDHNV